MNDNDRITAEETTKNRIIEEVKPDGEGKFDSLSKGDALREAIAIHKGEKEEPLESKPAPTNNEVKQAVDADVEAPSEFSAAGKAAWKAKDVAGIQKEFRRIHDSRTVEITRAQKAERDAREEGKTWRELGDMAKPYIEARGAEGVTPQKAMMEALALINEFKKGDPASVKAELLRIGIDLDKAPGQPSTPTEDPKIASLLKTVEVLEQKEKDREFNKTVQTFDTIFQNLTSQKTRTGDVVFPDLLDNSETGIAFARELGSLTQDQRFQAGVLRRFPNADLTIVVQEAYKYLGGKVSGEPVKVSPQSNQKHIEKSRRAAASTPGRIVSRTENSNLIGKLDRQAAVKQAIRDHREKYN